MNTILLCIEAATTLLLLSLTAMCIRNLADYIPLEELPAKKGDSLFILIPARNEEANIETCVRQILQQTYEDFTLIVLDDASTDGTAEIVSRICETDSRLHLVEGKPIQEGWAGKVWACSQLAERAINQQADWLLFLDADVRCESQFVDALLAHAQQNSAGMVSTFPYQITESLSERVVLPMLQFLITTFLPVRMVWESPSPAIVAACGQVELFSSQTYSAIGGHASIPHSFHDGLQLARKVKASGHSVRLTDASRLVSCHMYSGWKEVWKGFTRNAYEGLGSFQALVVMSTLLFVLFFMPFPLLIAAYVYGWAAWTSLVFVQIALIFLIRNLQQRRFGHPEAVILHPLSILCLVTIQWASWWINNRGHNVVWKGRHYS